MMRLGKKYDKFRAEYVIPRHRFGMACYYNDAIMVEILYACIEELQDSYNDLVNYLDDGGYECQKCRNSISENCYAQEKSHLCTT